MTQDNKFIRSLIESAKRGNNAALEQLFEMNLGKIYALSFLLTGDKPSADSITFNTFINAWDLTDTIDEDTTFSEWIKNITAYVALNELKKQDKPEEPKELENYVLIEKFPSFPVAKAYLKLSDTHRFILTLNFIENYSADVIAKMLDIETTDIAKRITDSIKTIIDDSDGKQTVDSVLEQLENLPTEVIPEKNLLKLALDKIHDVKFEDWEKEEKKRLKEEILKHRKETKEDKKEHKVDRVKIEKKKPKLHFNKKFLRYPIIIAILIAVVYYFFSVTVQWIIVVKSGTPQLNNRTIASNTEINIGDILQTNDFSEATLEMPDVGMIEVFESTTIERLDGSYSAKLINGKIIVNTDGAKEFLHIETSQADINEFNLGTNYILQTDEKGNSTIELIDGWLQLISGENEIIFPGEYKLKILKGAGAGLPYSISSTSKFIDLLEEYIFGRKSDITLDMIIESSSAKDGITLWNLLRVVKPGQRQAVYNKLYELFPHPDEIQREDILSLDENALYAWLEEIEWQM